MKHDTYLFGCGGKRFEDNDMTTLMGCGFYPSNINITPSTLAPYDPVSYCSVCDRCRSGKIDRKYCAIYRCDIRCQKCIKQSKKFEKLCGKNQRRKTNL